MDDFLRLVTSDFERIASNTGFRFNQYNGSVDEEYLEEFVINDIVDNTDVKSLSKLVASVLSYSYNIEKMSVSKKIFRLAQLIIDFLLHYKNHSSFKFNKKIDSMVLCEFCGELFMDISYLKYHCFLRHKLHSCTFTKSLDNEYVDSLKSEILQLQTQLKETTLTLENKLKNSQMYINNEHDLNNCNFVHKNKLSYHLIPQPYDNPMQIQEMYWKQKYESLEENYNTLKNEYEKSLSSTKSKTILDHKYQQCDFYKSEKSSKCIQTNILIEKSTPVCSPKRPPRRIDVIPVDEYKGICSMDISDIDQSNLDGYQRYDNLSSDKDFYELKKLRLEARMNIGDNIVCENLSEPLLSSDLVNSIKFVLILGQTRVNELFKNVPLMDLIKFEIKDLVNKRLEDHYSFVDRMDERVEQDTCLHEKIENQICSEVSICEDNKNEPHSSPEVDCIKTSVKKNKTVMSKLKKKAKRLSNIFSPSTKTKIIEVQPSTAQDPEISQSNEQCNNDNGNA